MFRRLVHRGAAGAIGARERRIITNGYLRTDATSTSDDPRNLFDENGVLRSVAANKARRTYLNGNWYHWRDGALKEESGYSQDLTSWDTVTTASVAQDAVGMDGSTVDAFTLSDTSAAARQTLGKAYTVPDDAVKRMGVFRVTKNNLTKYPLLRIEYTGGTTTMAQSIVFDKSDGSYVEVDTDGGVVWVLETASHWHVCLYLTNNSTGNTTCSLPISPAYNGDGTVTEDVSTQGDTVIVSAELYANDTSQHPSVHPIFTSGGTTKTLDAETPTLTTGSWFKGPASTIHIGGVTGFELYGGIRSSTYDPANDVTTEIYIQPLLHGTTELTAKIKYDDQGYPSHVVEIDSFDVSTIDAGFGSGTHPAFTVNGVAKSRVWIGQYEAVLHDSRALSLPGQDPHTNIDFDASLTACSAKGIGWHAKTNAESAAIQELSWAGGTIPNGNNNYGRDYAATSETGIRVDGLEPGVSSGGRVLTGSGPASWRHDGTFSGIADLNGNAWEWVGGMRLNAGEIQVLPDNDAADNTKDQSAVSAEWQAIDLATGNLVAPGTAGTAKYDSVNVGTSGNVGPAEIDDVIDNSNDPGAGDDGYTFTLFESLAADTGITVPGVMKQLGLAPAVSGLGGDRLWVRNYDERLPLRGGLWRNAANAGVFALSLDDPRTGADGRIGFRPAFVEGL